MPACASEGMTRYCPPSPPSPRSPSVSPTPVSPLSSSPPSSRYIPKAKSNSNTLNRTVSSTWPELNPPWTPSTPRLSRRRTTAPLPLTPEDTQSKINPNSGFSLWSYLSPTRLISWYFRLILRILLRISEAILFAIRAPVLWFSTLIYLLLLILQLPLTTLKYFLRFLYTSPSELARSKRCVLISGGSTVQAVHLARNFHKAGARVIVCEVEGLFSLARFSTACSKFYTIPKPGPGSAADYVKALKNIVEREKAVYYIPVSAANSAYYDALAKPHLEIAGCECFVPGTTEVTALDDPLELLSRCTTLGLTTPVHVVLRSLEDVTSLYESGSLRSGRHLMLAAGPVGMKDRAKIQLPLNPEEFRNMRQEISERRPWVVIRDPGGPHFITCTTVKESRVVANVTCRVDENKGLIPEVRADVSQWLDRFFARSFGPACTGRFSGHLSFRFVLCRDEVVTIGCRVGIGMPYVCLTSVHPRLVWRPCRHFCRQSSGPLIVGETYKGTDAFPSAVKQAAAQKSSAMQGAIDKREALFVYWDPLPYCAYYHLQLPLLRIAGAFRARTQHKPPLAVVVQ